MVILNGPSSSGKTTIATSFRDQRASVGEFWLLVGIDDVLSKLTVQWVDLGYPDGPGRHAADGLRFVPTPSGLRLEVGQVCRRLLHTYHVAAAEGVRSGLDVIVDDVIIDAATAQDWRDVLGDLRPTWVGVHCAPDVAIERERTRGDRPIGMTSTQTHNVHRHVEYAFQIDTTTLGPTDALAALNAGLRALGW
jgi:chloramphenicol 3-O phosphotransferase